MAGVGADGRKYLFERPTQDKVEMVLWRMVFGVRQREEDLRMECRERDEQCIRRERGLKEWEDRLEIRERKVEKNDIGIERMMRELRIKDSVIVSKEDEISDLKSEIEERVSRAREEHDREMKV